MKKLLLLLPLLAGCTPMHQTKYGDTGLMRSENSPYNKAQVGPDGVSITTTVSPAAGRIDENGYVYTENGTQQVMLFDGEGLWAKSGTVQSIGEAHFKFAPRTKDSPEDESAWSRITELTIKDYTSDSAKSNESLVAQATALASVYINADNARKEEILAAVKVLDTATPGLLKLFSDLAGIKL